MSGNSSDRFIHYGYGTDLEANARHDEAAHLLDKDEEFINLEDVYIHSLTPYRRAIHSLARSR